MSEKVESPQPVKDKSPQDDTGLWKRDESYKRVVRRGGNPSSAARSYCSGNVWMEQNAMAVGNIK